MHKSLSPHVLYPKSVIAWKAICDICRVVSNGSSQVQYASGQCQVHVDRLSTLSNQSPTTRKIIEPMKKQSGSEGGNHEPTVRAIYATSRPFDSLVCWCGHGVHVLVLFCTYYLRLSRGR